MVYLSQGWGLVDLPLRASSECWFIWSISSIWFVWLIELEIYPEEPDRPERPPDQTDEPKRVARAQKIIRLHPLLCSGSKGHLHGCHSLLAFNDSRHPGRDEHEDFETLVCMILHTVLFSRWRHGSLPWTQHLLL